MCCVFIRLSLQSDCFVPTNASRSLARFSADSDLLTNYDVIRFCDDRVTVFLELSKIFINK